MGDESRSYRTPFGDSMTWIAGEAATVGAYSLHHRIAPPGSASFAHSHARMSEAFYVISGRVTFTIGDRTIDAAAGDFAIALPGERHSWAVAGDDEAQVLVIFAPSVGRAYFEEMHDIVERADGRPAPEELATLAKKHGWD